MIIADFVLWKNQKTNHKDVPLKPGKPGQARSQQPKVKSGALLIPGRFQHSNFSPEVIPPIKTLIEIGTSNTYTFLEEEGASNTQKNQDGRESK
ncbi:MAG: hypothetical protein AAGE59_04630 [Cyanobacteria bacterium P01_F01_bin.86]